MAPEVCLLFSDVFGQGVRHYGWLLRVSARVSSELFVSLLPFISGPLRRAQCAHWCFGAAIQLCCLSTAFEDMLENPLNSTQWMNDPETGPVMLQISRIFQTLNRT